MSTSLQSERLELVSMDAAVLQALLDGNLHHAAHIGGFLIPEDILLRRSALVRRIEQLRGDPNLLPWLLRAVVVRESQTMCGRIGFHSRPGPPDLASVAPDGVELGYEIDPRFRRRGFAKEAALALMKWAFTQHGQKCFVLSISPSNEPSLAMAHSMGFVECGSQLDEEDGLELYFVRRLDQWPDEWSRVLGA